MNIWVGLLRIKGDLIDLKFDRKRVDRCDGHTDDFLGYSSQIKRHHNPFKKIIFVSHNKEISQLYTTFVSNSTRLHPFFTQTLPHFMQYNKMIFVLTERQQILQHHR